MNIEDSKEGGTPDSLNFEGYDPICCDHKLPSGFSSWIFLSGEQGAGPDMDVDIHLCCCGKCGEVKIGGRRLEKGILNHFHEEFGLHYPDAVAAIVKCCNWFCRDTEGYDPFVRLSDNATRIAQLEERLKEATIVHEKAMNSAEERIAALLASNKEYGEKYAEACRKNEAYRLALQDISGGRVLPHLIAQQALSEHYIAPTTQPSKPKQ